MSSPNLKDQKEPPPIVPRYQTYLGLGPVPAGALYPRGHESIDAAQEVVGNDHPQKL